MILALEGLELLVGKSKISPYVEDGFNQSETTTFMAPSSIT